MAATAWGEGLLATANPEWGEEFEFLVHTCQHQVGEGWLLQPGVRAGCYSLGWGLAATAWGGAWLLQPNLRGG